MLSNTKVPPKRSNSLKRTLGPSIEKGPNWLEILLPIHTVSEANCSEHWAKQYQRHKKQKNIVFLFLKPQVNLLKLPCHIKLTRYSPGQLDIDDNLPMSLKWITDAVCAVITGDYRPGRADADPRIKKSFASEKNKAYGVRLRIDLTGDE